MEGAKLPKAKRPAPLDVGYNEHAMDNNRKVLYRNFHEIHSKVYLVEISRNKTKVFICLFEDYENPNECIVQVLSEKLAFSMMRRHNNSFQAFVEKFSVVYNKLQIEGYHPKVVELKDPKLAKRQRPSKVESLKTELLRRLKSNGDRPDSIGGCEIPILKLGEESKEDSTPVVSMRVSI